MHDCAQTHLDEQRDALDEDNVSSGTVIDIGYASGGHSTHGQLYSSVRVFVRAGKERVGNNTKETKMSQSSARRAALVRYLAMNRSRTKLTGKTMQQIFVTHRLACRLSDA